MTATDEPRPFRLSFVCTGNICRSPMGEVIFRELAEQAGLGERFQVTSRGTHGYHVGDGADPRTVDSLAEAGFDGSAHRAAQFSRTDIDDNDLLIALDRGHERFMLAQGAPRDQVVLLTEFDPSGPADPDVFDPYYSDRASFDEVREQVERSCRALLDHLRGRIGA